MEEIIKLQNEYEYGGIIFLIHDDGIRRNVAYLDDDERELMINAIIALNTDNKYGYSGERDDPIVGGVSYWFKQDEIHQATHVHGGPAFLPWHRETVPVSRSHFRSRYWPSHGLRWRPARRRIRIGTRLIGSSYR